MENKYYVYEYVRLDTNEPFYIGKGTMNRWKDFNKRNKYFLNIIHKVPVAVNILHDNLDENTAFEYECWYIWQLRDIQGYWLANSDDGGKGGNTLLNKTDDELHDFSEKISNSLNDYYNTDEGKKRKEEISKQHKGKKMSDEDIEKWRQSVGDTKKMGRKGRTPWNKGKGMSEEQKKKISESLKRRNKNE
jgi:hypothetical protein